MRKAPLLVACVAILALCVCSCRSSVSPAKYTGTWYSEDYKQEPRSRDRVFVGTEMTLQVSESGTGGVIKLLHVSAPPQSRIAHVEAEWKLTANGEAKFRFDDDSWGNRGTGTVLFGTDKVTVKMEVELSETSNWHVFVGQKTFRRKK